MNVRNVVFKHKIQQIFDSFIFINERMNKNQINLIYYNLNYE